MKDLRMNFNKLNADSKRILDIIIKSGATTKNEILKITKMKLTTLNRFLEPLEEFDLIEQIGVGESSGGRKPTLYGIKEDSFYIFGIDISRTYTQIILVNMKMNIICKERFIMDESTSPEITIQKLTEVISKTLNDFDIPHNKILGLGIGTVGPIDREKGIIKNPVNFESIGWLNVPIKSMFEENFDFPVFIDNGSNTAVLAEYILGVGKGMNNIAYFNCGIGIRTGTITSGVIIRSINDGEDAFGHMVIDVDGDLCSCGNYGCIECYSSIKAVTRKFTAEVKKGRITKIHKALHEINYKDITKAAEEKDSLSKEIIIGAASIMGAGLVNYINLLNPNIIILSGPLIKSSSLFYDTCVKVANSKNFLRGNSQVFFNKEGSFGEDAISIGAAVMVINDFLST
ncbi:ROK family protein [Clostridium grantii]|uniref:Sugar kinase of the NBD/HSP70 family, may contain an N-terminal HTH domain n=1 Tax=Clostridium grantii DSM 8605 TaxID=1121316 RepID=A0A1M5W132_9CLOT|nr:ROK family protein [Clostridium grantii]SHH80914.1 Sugar kinase of the NBD/HSP70 family, may contain an N-terminal HTH domain [Clostridium grantii DSM 8605]